MAAAAAAENVTNFKMMIEYISKTFIDSLIVMLLVTVLNHHRTLFFWAG